jgi:hypothetical protein
MTRIGMFGPSELHSRASSLTWTLPSLQGIFCLGKKMGLRAYIRSVCAALVAADPDGIRWSMPLLLRGLDGPSELEG